MKIEPASMIEPTSANSESGDDEFNDLINEEMKVKKIVKVVRDISSIKKYKKKRMKRVDLNDVMFCSALHSSSLCFDSGIVIGNESVKVKARSEFSMQEIIDRSKLNNIIRDLSIKDQIKSEVPVNHNLSEINSEHFTIKKSDSVLLLSRLISLGDDMDTILLFPFNKYRLVGGREWQGYSEKIINIYNSITINVERSMFKLNPLQSSNFIFDVNEHSTSTTIFMKVARKYFPMNTSNSLAGILYHNRTARNYRVFFKGFHYIFKLNGDIISFDKE
ncbi:hypothetical protein NUF46_004244 [Yersinia enterocolitica]|uniref:hypothetical protein n=1 Tax=Yersinia enterocolitica TaxID=630 RepID=UPI00094BB205|nr:hypothetical protein [Yersinia enterocolitica]EKN4037914.1 hypothetical protein [Yersinia enterocolitica]